MRYNNPRRNRFRSNDKGFRRNGSQNSRASGFSSDSNSFQRRPFSNNGLKAEKLLEKYNNLAKEALSNGDKILSENYYQHADHFLRIMIGQKILKAESTKVSNKLVGAEINENGLSDTNNKTIEPEAK